MAAGVTVRARLELKIDADLKEWAAEYAKKRGTTLTEIICDQLRLLRQADQKRQPGDIVEQF